MEPKQPKSFPRYDYSVTAIKGIEIIDRSRQIASITSLNGMINGGTGPQMPDFDNQSLKVELHNPKKKVRSTWLSHAFMRMLQTLCIIDNLNFTKNGASL